MTTTAFGHADFAAIYATDLVYVPGCWQLCGDAHCCSFSRSKVRFRMLGGGVKAQELPLLPGEYEHLVATGAIQQFGDHDHRIVHFAFGQRRMRIESIVSRRPGCACNAATRTTVCRLYPFLPVLDATGRMSGLARLGMFDLMDEMDGVERICQIEAVPEIERPKLQVIVDAIVNSPSALFAVMAYKAAQDHLRERLTALKGEREVSHYSVFETALLRNRLIDKDALGARLTDIADAIEAQHGPLHLAA